ncbi:MAG: hypothetical protein JNK82_07355 [Myxococcaceae bacterium]|nr:hypothetical protein [Myxococcaceae bacterium]
MPPSKEWKEVVSDGEDARFLGYAEYLQGLQRARAQKGRALHLKQNLALKGELVIDPDLPEPARHGLGARPGRYGVWVRLSNGSGASQPDPKGDLRGFALKVIGVDGKKVIPGMESARTQDLLFINHPITAMRNTDEFLAIVKGMQTPALLLPRLIGAVGFFRALAILKAAVKDLGFKMTSVATTDYFTAAPISWGPYAVKVKLEARAKPDPSAKAGGTPGYIGEELTSRVKANAVVYDLRIQHYVDPTSTPIEEHDREWHSPWLTIGTLTLPAQDVTSPEGRALQAKVEAASFDPWHALVEHRPLGNVMRARNHAYRLSTQERGAAAEPEQS